MRWVLTTPMGGPVEPEVKRILAMVSGPTAAKRASTSGPGGLASSSRKGVVAKPAGGLAPTTISNGQGSPANSAVPELPAAALPGGLPNAAGPRAAQARAA